MAQVADKPENIREKIAEGKLNAWYGEAVLMDQPFVKDDTKTIRDMILAVNARTGENITVARFARFVVGEGAVRPAGVTSARCRRGPGPARPASRTGCPTHDLRTGLWTPSSRAGPRSSAASCSSSRARASAGRARGASASTR